MELTFEAQRAQEELFHMSYVQMDSYEKFLDYVEWLVSLNSEQMIAEYKLRKEKGFE